MPHDIRREKNLLYIIRFGVVSRVRPRENIATPPPFPLLDAGEAYGRRRRALRSVYASSTSSLFVVLNFSIQFLTVSYVAAVLGPFIVIFSPALRFTAVSPAPLFVTTHPLRKSRSDETRTRSAPRCLLCSSLSRLFPYPDFSDEHNPSMPPGGVFSISDDSPSRVFILFELCFAAEPKPLSRLRSPSSVRQVVVSHQKMNFRSANIEDFELHFQTSSIRNAQHEPDASNPALRALFSLRLLQQPPEGGTVGKSCLVTPIPSESGWYSTDICFGLIQNHLWSLNVLIVINLSHYSSSEASCLSTVCCRASVQRVHLAQNHDVVLKLQLLVHPSQVSRVCFNSDFVTGAIRFQGPSNMFVIFKSMTFTLSVSVEIYLVSFESFDIGARAVHARSTSCQTLPFGQINVDSDYFMLVVVTYSGTRMMLPTVLHLSSKTLLSALLSLVLVFCVMMFIKSSRIPPVTILLALSLAPDVIV